MKWKDECGSCFRNEKCFLPFAIATATATSNQARDQREYNEAGNDEGNNQEDVCNGKWYNRGTLLNQHDTKRFPVRFNWKNIVTGARGFKSWRGGGALKMRVKARTKGAMDARRDERHRRVVVVWTSKIKRGRLDWLRGRICHSRDLIRQHELRCRTDAPSHGELPLMLIMNGSINQSTDQSSKASTNQPINKSSKPSINQSINQSNYQSIEQSLSGSRTVVGLFKCFSVSHWQFIVIRVLSWKLTECLETYPPFSVPFPVLFGKPK